VTVMMSVTVMLVVMVTVMMVTVKPRAYEASAICCGSS